MAAWSWRSSESKWRADDLSLHPAGTWASNEFRRTGLYKWLVQRETPIITIPEMHSVSKNYWEELEDKHAQHLSISKVIATKDCLDVAYFELSGVKDMMFRQFEDAARYLMPEVAHIKERVTRVSDTAPPKPVFKSQFAAKS